MLLTEEQGCLIKADLIQFNDFHLYEEESMPDLVKEIDDPFVLINTNICMTVFLQYIN